MDHVGVSTVTFVVSALLHPLSRATLLIPSLAAYPSRWFPAARSRATRLHSFSLGNHWPGYLSFPGVASPREKTAYRKPTHGAHRHSGVVFMWETATAHLKRPLALPALYPVPWASHSSQAESLAAGVVVRHFNPPPPPPRWEICIPYQLQPRGQNPRDLGLAQSQDRADGDLLEPPRLELAHVPGLLLKIEGGVTMPAFAVPGPLNVAKPARVVVASPVPKTGLSD